MTVVAPVPQASSQSQIETASSGPAPSSTGRLVSLDAYRGFVMLLMASGGLGIAHFVEKHHITEPAWKFLASQTDHVQWRGGCLWDLIQPSFTFIVGVAMPFSLARRRSQGQSMARLTFHAVVRSLILIALGIFLRSGGKSQTYFTFEDTLTQIGLGYTFAFLLAWTRPRTQAIAIALILAGYWAAFALYPAPAQGAGLAGVTPQWHDTFGLHGFAAHWDKNTNLAARFDQFFLNLFPRGHRFVYNEGGYQTLNFIPTLATMLLGLLAGELLRGGQSSSRKFLILIGAGLLGLLFGSALDAAGICPIVKRIWTPAWTIYSAGWCCLLLAGFFAAIDWAGLRAWSFPLVVVGMNSIAMYLLADGGFAHFVRESLDTHLGPYDVFARVLGPYGLYGPILESAVVLVVLWLVCFWMYRRKIFLRI